MFNVSVLSSISPVHVNRYILRCTFGDSSIFENICRLKIGRKKNIEKNMRRFRQFLLEPLKIDFDDEDVFIDSNSHGNYKMVKNQNVSDDSPVVMTTGNRSCDHVDSGSRGDNHVRRDVSKWSAGSEEDTFFPHLSRQPSWGLHRNRSSKKKRDFFR